MAKAKWVRLALTVLLLTVMVTGYGGLCQKKSSGGSSGSSGGGGGGGGTIYTISDGTMEGIGDYVGLIHANINCNPNSGPAFTPVTVIITFTSGGSYVNAIKVYQKVPGGSWTYTPDCDPYKQSANVWHSPSDLVLTGVAAWVKFVGVDSGLTEIVLGTIAVNNP